MKLAGGAVGVKAWVLFLVQTGRFLSRSRMTLSPAAEQPSDGPHIDAEHANVEPTDPPGRPRAQPAEDSGDKGVPARRPVPSRSERGAAGEGVQPVA